MGERGFLGVHLPEEYGGGGGGLGDLAIVIEESAAQGCPMFMLVISPAIAGRCSRRTAPTELKEGWLPGIADGTKGSPSRSPSPTRAPTPTRSRPPPTREATGGGCAAEVLDLRHRRGRRGARRAARPRPGPKGADPVAVPRPHRAPGLTFQQIDSALQMPENQFMVFFDDVPVAPRRPHRRGGGGLRQMFAGLNPERIAAAALANGIARYAMSPGRAATPRSDGVVPAHRRPPGRRPPAGRRPTSTCSSPG